MVHIKFSSDIFLGECNNIRLLILIADEPSKPGRPNPTNWDKDFVDLEWTKPASDGGAPIDKYIIQMRDKNERSWVDVGAVPGDRCVHRVCSTMNFLIISASISSKS